MNATPAPETEQEPDEADLPDKPEIEDVPEEGDEPAVPDEEEVPEGEFAKPEVAKDDETIDDAESETYA
jgi:hypothetical protein